MIAPNALQSITLQSSNYAESIAFYRDRFGLNITDHSSEHTVFGTSQETNVVKIVRGQVAGLLELHFVYNTKDQLASALKFHQSAARIVDSGTDWFSIRDPQNILIVCTVGASPLTKQPDQATSGRPLFLSHLVLNSQNPAAYVDYYSNILGLTISDAYEKGLLTFLRANQPQHHCVGISPGETNGLNHFAMDCGTIDGVMSGVGRMQGEGQSPLWGPGRHGPGGNIFAYFEDPDGMVAEFTCDVMQIKEPASHTPREWDRTPANGNVWGTGGPSERAVGLMAGRLWQK